MKGLTRESLDRCVVSVGGAPLELGCTKHPAAGVSAFYVDGHVRLLCRGCGFEVAQVKVALRSDTDKESTDGL